MLVFTRKRNESIVIGEGIEVRILRVEGDSVRLGVTADPAVPVHRREIYEQIRETNRRAISALESALSLAGRLRRAGFSSATPEASRPDPALPGIAAFNSPAGAAACSASSPAAAVLPVTAAVSDEVRATPCRRNTPAPRRSS